MAPRLINTMMTANTVAAMNSADRDMKQGKAKGDWAFQARALGAIHQQSAYLPSAILKRQSSHISSQATDSVNSDRMQDIRGVQASLYSYAAPQR